MFLEDFLNIFSAGFVVKIFFVLFLIFFSIFALILFRQIQIMAKSLPMSLAPFLKFVAIILIGISLALLFIVLGVF
jgi:hypothetical protein